MARRIRTGGYLFFSLALLALGCSTELDEGLEEDFAALYEESLGALPSYSPFPLERGALVFRFKRGGAAVVEQQEVGRASGSLSGADGNVRVIELPIGIVSRGDLWPYSGGWRVLTSVALLRVGFVNELFDLPYSGGQMIAMTGGYPRPRAAYVDEHHGTYFTAVRMADDGARELALESAEIEGGPPCEGVMIIKYGLLDGERTATRCLDIPPKSWLYTLDVAPDGQTMVLKYRDGEVHHRPLLALFNFETGDDFGTLQIETDLIADGTFLEGSFYYLRYLSGAISRLVPANPGAGTALRDEVILEFGPHVRGSDIIPRLLFDERARLFRVVHTDGVDTQVYTFGPSGVVSSVSVEDVVGRNADLDHDGNIVLREFNKTWEHQPGHPAYEPPEPEQLVERLFTVDPETGVVIDSLSVRLPVEAFWHSFFFVAP